MATMLLAAAGPDKLTIARSWLALVAMEGWVIRKRAQAGPAQYWYVVHANRFGLLVWPVKAITVTDDFRLFEFDLAGCLTMEIVKSYQNYNAVEVTCESPIAMARLLAEAGAYSDAMNLRLKPKGKPKHLATLSAENAFLNLTAPQLSKLATIEGMKFARGKRPTRTEPWLRVLCRHFLGDISEEEMALILKKRTLPKTPHVYDGLLLDPENSAFIEEGFAEDEVAEVQQFVDKEVKNRSQHGGGGAGGDGGGGGGSASAGGASSSTATVVSRPDVHTFTPAWAKDKIPRGIPGCFLYRDDARRFRWQAGYTLVTNPHAQKRFPGIVKAAMVVILSGQHLSKQRCGYGLNITARRASHVRTGSLSDAQEAMDLTIARTYFFLRGHGVSAKQEKSQGLWVRGV